MLIETKSNGTQNYENWAVNWHGIEFTFSPKLDYEGIKSPAKQISID